MSGCPNHRSFYSYGTPVLNRTHPFARGLRNLGVAQKHHGPIIPGRSIQGQPISKFNDLALNGNSFDSLTVGCGAVDNGVYSIGNTANLFPPKRLGTEYWPPPPVINNFTMISYFNRTGTSTHSVVGAWGSVNMTVLNDSTVNSWKKVGGTYRNTVAWGGVAPVTGKPEVLAVSYSSTDGAKCYYRGILVGENSSDMYVKSNIDVADDLTTLFGQRNLDSYNFIGMAYWAGFWDRVVGPKEIAALSRDPLALIQASRFSAPGWARGHQVVSTPWLYARQGNSMIGGR